MNETDSKTNEPPVQAVATRHHEIRRHDLDALRAFAMLLGIVLHSSLAYVTFRYWPVFDTKHDPAFDQITRTIHGFRMPLFMVLSGFFTAMLWRRRGLGKLALHRLKRIALPLLVGFFTIISLFGPAIKLSQWIEASLGPGSVEMHPWEIIKRDDVEKLKKLLAKANKKQAFVDQQDLKFQLPLLNWTAMHGAPGCAQFLVDQQANVNIQSGDGSSPLLHAAMVGQVEVVRILLKAGADPNLINVHQSTALDASYAGPEIIKWVAGQLKLKIRDDLEKHRAEVRVLLREYGGKHIKELQTEKLPPEPAENKSEVAPKEAETVSALRKKLNALRSANGSMLRWPGFHMKSFHHLWFLWHLCLLFIPFVIYALIASGLQKQFSFTGLPEWLFRTPIVYLWVVPLTWLPQWLQNDFGPDTSTSLFAMPHVLLLYMVYFLFGAMYHDRRKSPALPKSEGDAPKDPPSLYWWLALPIALLLISPLALRIQHKPEEVQWLVSGDGRMVLTLLHCTYTWLMIFGLVGLFRVIASKERYWIRYLSDSSYWLYLAHLPTMFVIHALFKHAPLNIWLKFVLTCLITTGLLLVIYDLGIRYTVIGTVLNGKRKRPEGGRLRFWINRDAKS